MEKHIRSSPATIFGRYPGVLTLSCSPPRSRLVKNDFHRRMGIDVTISSVTSVVDRRCVRLAQMGMEDPSSHSEYRARALGRRAQSQPRDRGNKEDRE